LLETKIETESYKKEGTLVKWLEKYADHAYAFMRIRAGLMFLFHGTQKILGVLSEFQPPVGSMTEVKKGLATYFMFYNERR
jgi:uncharacterized membrane protein YphA (DoxX/SURF4 family)